ncbi:hypothetical protein WA158_002692 [Blastocystis sp. Blastoise]
MSTPGSYYYIRHSTILGTLTFIEHNKKLTNILFEKDEVPARMINKKTKLLEEVSNQIDSYLDGERKSFTIPLDPKGTPFMLSIYKSLQKVPYGKVTTYGSLASSINNTKAVRAVGSALHKNPIPIIIPCHRVINKNGDLGEFGGGVPLKKILLKLEHVTISNKNKIDSQFLDTPLILNKKNEQEEQVTTPSKDENKDISQESIEFSLLSTVFGTCSSFLEYDQTALNHLTMADPQLGEYIQEVGKIEVPLSPDLFQALVESIIAQQISTKASRTVSQRFYSKFKLLTPQAIHKCPVEEIQKLGVSMRKAEYIKSAASVFVKKRYTIDYFANESDDVILKDLTEIKGIGTWTVEMLMIFCFGRLDILSLNDLTIRSAMEQLHHVRKISKDDVVNYKELYSPYNSIASIYLWQYLSAHPKKR